MCSIRRDKIFKIIRCCQEDCRSFYTFTCRKLIASLRSVKHDKLFCPAYVHSLWEKENIPVVTKIPVRQWAYIGKRLFITALFKFLKIHFVKDRDSVISPCKHSHRRVRIHHPVRQVVFSLIPFPVWSRRKESAGNGQIELRSYVKEPWILYTPVGVVDDFLSLVIYHVHILLVISKLRGQSRSFKISLKAFSHIGALCIS